jgi:hypothetical protein
MPTMTDVRKQVITGVVPPTEEALIRTAWPSVAGSPGAGLAGKLGKTFFLSPLAGLMMAPFYFRKVLPFFARRYALTNQRLMIQRGIRFKPAEQIELSKIDDVRIVPGSQDDFYRSATLEVISNGQVALTLPAVQEAESFRHAVLNAARSWGKKARTGEQGDKETRRQGE